MHGALCSTLENIVVHLRKINPPPFFSLFSSTPLPFAYCPDFSCHFSSSAAKKEKERKEEEPLPLFLLVFPLAQPFFLHLFFFAFLMESSHAAGADSPSPPSPPFSQPNPPSPRAYPPTALFNRRGRGKICFLPPSSSPQCTEYPTSFGWVWAEDAQFSIT